jgi:hypothetical protein
LLLLLALIVALPATARPACHDAGPAVGARAAMPHATAMHHAGSSSEGEHHGARVGGHDCLGCIPPDMLIGARVDGSMPPPMRARPARVVSLAPGDAPRPTPPPPKTA